ncbi:MAG TPA: NAD(P)H-binding protein [Thermoleophilaceae bacterium]|nr:NAD(P)H-binding protein [Thermoleophilaceae bacterium]
MILLTGATGNVGSALLRRLTSSGGRVRCLVRDPRRLGPERVRVQIALGDLSEPTSFRNALRGVDTVVHLAASIRDQQRASIEELNAVATLRLLRAAENSGVERFVFFSALGAGLHNRARFFRAKALAERTVEESPLATTIFAPSIVYSPRDPWIRLLERMSLLPVMPISGSGRARYQPIWADDAAAAVMGALERTNGRERYDLAGPETLSYDEIARETLRALRRRRRLLHVPLPVVRAGLRTVETLSGQAAFATWEEAELMEIPMTTPRGTADAEELGVSPRAMREVLGA